MLFRETVISEVTTKLKSAASGTLGHQRASVDQTIRALAMNRQLTVETFPVVLTRLSRGGHWQAALAVLQAPSTQTLRLLRDDGLWKVVHDSLPSVEAQTAAHPVLQRLFSQSRMSSLPSGGKRDNKGSGAAFQQRRPPT